jgi:hypothetical protein
LISSHAAASKSSSVSQVFLFQQAGEDTAPAGVATASGGKQQIHAQQQVGQV